MTTQDNNNQDTPNIIDIPLPQLPDSDPKFDPEPKLPGAKPKLELTKEQWKLIEQYSQAPTSSFMGLARIVGIKTKQPGEVLKRAIKRHYKVDPKLWLAHQQEEGIAKFGLSFYASAVNPKSHPAIKIFAAKNWLGMKDEKTIVNPAQTDTQLKVLSTLNRTLERIAARNPQQSTPKLESPDQRTEYAEFTETPISRHSNLPNINTIDTSVSNNIIGNNKTHSSEEEEGGETVPAPP